MKLVIEYHAESDTLRLGNSETASDGEDVAKNVIVFFRDDRPVAVQIDHAAALLGPILSARADYPAVEARPTPPVSADYPALGATPNPADSPAMEAAAAGPAGE